MANIRVRALSLLADGNLTATSIAEKLGVDRSAASHAIARAHSAGEAHIADWRHTGRALAAVYAVGGGVDAERPAPLDPNVYSAAYRERHPDRNRASSRAWRERNLEHVLAKQAEYRARSRADATPESVDLVKSCSQNPVFPAKEIAVSESVLEYFELPEMPGRRFFKCEPLRASMLVESCAERWTLAQGQTEGKYQACKRCARGASHAGAAPDLNVGTLKGSLTCSRCHRMNGRLIGKRLCISCMNRQYESIKQRNAKGTAPIKHPPLHRLTIGYMAAGKVRTHTVERAVDMTELIVDVLRDSEHSPRFGWLADPATRALRDIPDLDLSISDDVDEVVPVADVALPAELDVVQANPTADVEVDSLQALRDVLDRDDRDAPVSTSRRAAKKLRQQARRRVRVSAVTVGLLRTIGALPPPAPVVVPAPQPFYSASFFSD